MGKKRCRGHGGDKDGSLAKGDLIQKILVRLPVTSLLRFKSVCKSWCDLIQSSSFIDLHTATTFNSSSKFGSFILLTHLHKYSYSRKTFQTLREHSFIMLSSSESELPESGAGDWPWSKHDANLDNNNNNLEGGSWSSSSSKDPQVFKVEVDNNNNNNLGEGLSSSNEDDQLLMLKLDSLGVPSCLESSDSDSFKEIVGSCNGLVCLSEIIPNLVSLCNPATKQHRILPKPIEIGDCPRHFVAFGFDVKTRDYNVVLLSCFRPEYWRTVSPIECLCRVQVYSLSTDSWRLLEGITCLPGYPLLFTDTIYLNGSCFFQARFFRNKQQSCFPESDRFIISFDLTKEIITPIQLPVHHRDQELYLSSLGDKIALFTKSSHNYGTCEDYNLWVLKEHDGSSNSSVNKESWTKLHFFQIKHKLQGESSDPIGLWNDGEFALLKTSGSTAFGKMMKLYNLVTKEVKKDFLSCSEVMSKANAYKPSLVSIIGGNGSSRRRRR